jgi:peroxin-5
VARNPDNAQAWRLLGQTHAQSDKDDRAIAALRKALSIRRALSLSLSHIYRFSYANISVAWLLDTTGITPNDLEALMSLAVSYTNEMYREEALTVLERWIQSNPRYKGRQSLEIFSCSITLLRHRHSAGYANRNG